MAHNLTLMLYADGSPIPDDKWRDAQQNHLITHWYVTYSKRDPNRAGSYSNVYLTSPDKVRRNLGAVMLAKSYGGWWAFGMHDKNGKFMNNDMKGFVSRHYATVYMLSQQGYIKDPMRY